MDDRDFQLAATSILASESWKKEGFRLCYKPFFYREDGSEGLQSVHTPFSLCRDIIQKLTEFVDVKEASVCVLYNLEFVDILVREYGVSPKNITFFPDSEQEASAARIVYGVRVAGPIILDDKNKPVMPKIDKKFDVVIMNPPYQKPVNKNRKGGTSGGGKTIYQDFVEIGLSLTVDDGFLATIHPCRWRKPDDSLYQSLVQYDIRYLDLNSKQTGTKVFKADTPFDWYVLQKSKNRGKTSIKDYDGNLSIIDLRKFEFVPNGDFELIQNLMASSKQNRCEVLHSAAAFYVPQQDWLSKEPSKEFPNILICNTGKNKVVYWYSSRREDLYFDVPKLIFGENDVIANSIVDYKGEFGLTYTAIGIPISSEEEGEQMKKALESKAFNDLLQHSLRWSQFRIDWRMFRHFRKDFWKDFL